MGKSPWAGLEQESRGKGDPAMLQGFILPRSEDRTRTLPVALSTAKGQKLAQP